MADATWDQSRFYATLKEYLLAHESRVWPQLVNKKAFYVALTAFQQCDRATPLRIKTELSRPVMASRPDGTRESVPVGYVIAAKRASLRHTRSARFERAAQRELAQEFGGRGRTDYYGKAWLANLREENKRLVGKRLASLGFLRAGFVSIVYLLGPIVGDGRRPASKDLRGPVKGSVLHLATAGSLSVTIENRAHSRTEKLGGFERIGGMAMQRAVDIEAFSMVVHMEKEMEPEIHKFNAKQR